MILILALMNFACAAVQVSAALAPRGDVDGRWSLHVVTVDEDESDRVTRIWIATPYYGGE